MHCDRFFFSCHGMDRQVPSKALPEEEEKMLLFLFGESLRGVAIVKEQDINSLCMSHLH